MQIPITKIWAPLLSFEKPSAGKKTLVLRFLVLFLIGGLGYGLYMTGPAPDTLKASVKDAHDSMLQYFVSGHTSGLRAGASGGQCVFEVVFLEQPACHTCL